MKIHENYTQHLSTQSYEAKPTIEGVEIIPLPFQSDDGGNFSEIVRLNGGMIAQTHMPFEAKQVSFSLLTPGAIKAYHCHQHQDDLWYTLPTQRLIVNLHDVREDSTTFDMHMRIVMGGGKNFLLRIPHGVAHGVANQYEHDMILFYFTNQHFNIQDPDEHRLPWDIFGADVWEIIKG